MRVVTWRIKTFNFLVREHARAGRKECDYNPSAIEMVAPALLESDPT